MTATLIVLCSMLMVAAWELPIRAGFGGIIRNSAGLFLKGFSGYISTSFDILFAELTAIHRGILLAIDSDIDEMVCYSDSMLSSPFSSSLSMPPFTTPMLF